MCWLHNRLAAVAVVNKQLKYSCSKFRAWPVATSKNLRHEFAFVMHMFGQICTFCCLYRATLDCDFLEEFVFLFCISVHICFYTCIRCAISRSHKQEMFFTLQTFSSCLNFFWNQSCGRLCSLFLKSDYIFVKLLFILLLISRKPFPLPLLLHICVVIHIPLSTL